LYLSIIIGDEDGDDDGDGLFHIVQDSFVEGSFLVGSFP
jgi:hypothetical protein